MCVGINGDIVPPGRALRLDHQPQFPRPPGPRRAHASDVAGDGRGRGGQRASRRCAAAARRPKGVGVRADGKIRSPHRQGLSAAAAQCQHRPDSAGAVSEMAALGGARAVSCSTICAATPTARSEPTFRSTGRLGATPRFLSPAAISAAARRARPRSMRSTKPAFRCVIAPSFGDIFAQNSVKNGLLTAILSEADASELGAAIAADPDMPVTVDLEQQTISRGNRSYRLHHRSGQPQSAAQWLGRRRPDRKLSRAHRRVQGCGSRPASLGAAA